ncbi:MAG: FHA domain-containing protein [Bdellovibrionales bacterium]|nr:FHA domain-containing protein [Bdellovibrionales bacterium]
MNDNQLTEEEENAEDEATSTGTSSRARNRTVLLTPEITGQVRSMLGGGEGRERGGRDPLADLLPPLTGGDSEPRPSQMFQDSSDYGSDIHADSGVTSVEEDRDPTGKMRLGAQTQVHSVQPKPAPAFSVNQTGAGRAAPRAQRAPQSKIVGFLVSFDNNEFGEVFEIRAGRWLLTSRPTDHGEYILIDDETISPLHAIIRATRDGTVQILDQLSEFGTAVISAGSDEEKEVTGSLVGVDHGDVVRFGERRFVVCRVPEVSLPSSDGDADSDD